MRCIVLCCLPLQATCKGTLNVAKIQYKLRVASGLVLPWYGSMKWNMEENFSMEWNMEWKIFSMEWKWNGRKLPVWITEKSTSIPFHTMPWIPARVRLVTSTSLCLHNLDRKMQSS